jgi:hypothetical protein
VKRLTALIVTLTLAAGAALGAAAAEKKADPAKKAEPAKADEAEKPKGGWSADTWSGLALRSIGPAVTSGRDMVGSTRGFRNPRRPVRCGDHRDGSRDSRYRSVRGGVGVDAHTPNV